MNILNIGKSSTSIYCIKVYIYIYIYMYFIVICYYVIHMNPRINVMHTAVHNYMFLV